MTTTCKKYANVQNSPLFSVFGWVIYFIVLFVLVSLCDFTEASEKSPSKKKKRRPTPVLSLSVYKKMSAVQEDFQNEDYAQATLKLLKLLEREAKLKPYDKAKIYEMLSNTHVGTNEPEKALAFSQKALALEVLGDTSQRQLYRRVFYLYFSLDEYDKALTYMEKWFSAEPNPPIQAYFTAAQAYALTEDMDTALDYALQGMQKVAQDEETQAKESWYQLLISIRLKRQDYQEVSHLLAHTITLWPHRVQYYQQLSAVYQELKQEKASFAILSIAYQNQLLDKASDIERLAQQYRYHEYPFKSAHLLKHAMEAKTLKLSEQNWESQANAWLHAREWPSADKALLEAAKLSDKGLHWLFLCQTSFQNEHWGKSQTYCENAIEKGGLKTDESSAWYLLALAQYYEEKLIPAISSFEKCQQWANTEKDCKHWHTYIQQALASKTEEQERLQKEQQEKERRQREQQQDMQRVLELKS